MDVKIFVEGIADTKFLKDYISKIYNVKLNDNDIIESKGWSNIFSSDGGELLINKMVENVDNGIINLMIFDADNNFINRQSEINIWKSENNLNFELFLWPNNSLNGDLESVLENIINSNNQPIFDCWDNYETCLTQQQISGRENPLTTPARKTKIYGYLEALLGNSNSQKEKIKELKRDYKNSEYWNLNSSYLNNLKLFLDKYFL